MRTDLRRLDQLSALRLLWSLADWANYLSLITARPFQVSAAINLGVGEVGGQVGVMRSVGGFDPARSVPGIPEYNWDDEPGLFVWGLSTQQNAAMAALLRWLGSPRHSFVVHHVGRACFSQADRDEAVHAARLAGNLVVSLAGDGHARHYWYVPDDSTRGLLRGHYRELQWWGPENKKQMGRTHIDVWVDDPDMFLRYVGDRAGVEPIFFQDSGPDDPIGVVWLRGREGEIDFGVMARPRWWNLHPLLFGDVVG